VNSCTWSFAIALRRRLRTLAVIALIFGWATVSVQSPTKALNLKSEILLAGPKPNASRFAT
jgi:hypothetical protein